MSARPRRAPNAAPRYTRGLFCDGDLLRSLSRQEVYLETTPTRALKTLAALAEEAPRPPAPYPLTAEFRAAVAATDPGEGEVWRQPPAEALPWLCRDARRRARAPRDPFHGASSGAASSPGHTCSSTRADMGPQASSAPSS